MGRLSWRTHAAVGAGLFVALVIFHWRILLATGSAQGWLWEDALEYFYPVHSLAAVWTAHGSLPLWDPFTFAGMPLLADIGAGLLYPPNFLLALFTHQGTLSYRAFEWAMALHVWLGGFGAWLVAYRLTRSVPGGVMAGAVFMLSGFMTAHSIHLSIVQTAAWLPFIFWFSLRAVEEGRARDAVAAGLLLGTAALAGHPQTTLLVAGAALLPAVANLGLHLDGGGRDPGGTTGGQRFAGGRAWRLARPFLLFALTAGVAMAIAAPQLMATRQLLGLTIRQEMSYGAAAEGSFTPWNLLTLLMPNYFGKAHGRNWASYWGPGNYFYYWELAAFAGVAALILAAFALARREDAVDRRRILLLAVLGAAGLLLAMGRFGLLHFVLYEALPPLRRLRIPARAVLLFDFAVALLAAYGLRALVGVSAAAERRRVGRWARVAAGVVGFALLAGLVRLGGAGGGPRTDVAVGAIIQLALAGAATVVTLFAVAAGRLSPRARSQAFLAIAVLDLAAAGWGYSAGAQSPREFFTGGREEIIAALRDEGRRDYFRVNGRPDKNPEAMVLRRNSGPILGIYTIEGYNQLKLAVFQDFKVPPDLRLDLLNVKYRSELETGALRIVSNPGYLARVSVVERWREMKAPAEVLEAMNAPGFDPRTDLLLLPDADASGRMAAPAAPPESPAPGAERGASTAKITRYEPNRIEADVNASAAGFTLFSEIWYPAWRATVDGKPAPVRRADYAFRAVPVPAGRHHVEIVMSDAPIRRGSAAGAAGLLAALALVLVDLRKRRR